MVCNVGNTDCDSLTATVYGFCEDFNVSPPAGEGLKDWWKKAAYEMSEADVLKIHEWNKERTDFVQEFIYKPIHQRAQEILQERIE